MPYTLSYFVFYLVVLSQVLLLSFYLPRTVLRRLRRVIDEHPPSTYPKLYPMSIEVVERGLRRYRIMNLLILLAGLALVFTGIYAPSADMLNWDNQAVLALYACLQFSPMLLVERSGLKYYRLMRKGLSAPLAAPTCSLVVCLISSHRHFSAWRFSRIGPCQRL